MRIVIDGRMMGPRWTGIGLYTQKLVENLAAVDHDNQYIILMGADNFTDWTPPAPNFSKVLAPYKIYGLAEQLLLPFKLRGLKPDLVHFLHNVPVLYRGRRVVIVHDTTMVDFDLAPAGLLGGLKYKIKRIGMMAAFRSITSATAIITPSKATKEQLLSLLKVPADLINVIYESAEAGVVPNRTIDATNPTLLYVGTLYPYKNVAVILNALPILLKDHPDLLLKIIGSTPRFNQSVKDQIEQLKLSTSVELAGFVSEVEKTGAYRAATLFVFPSLSEGFGLPPLEAMAQGLPVLAAQASALPEVLGNGADYFDPHDPKDLAAKIQGLLDDPKRLSDLQQRGQLRLKDFSWQKMATETLAVYNKVKPV